MKVLNINVVGPFLVTKYFLPLLKKKQTRVVVNTSSICGSISANFKGDFGGYLLPYNSSKAAINMRMPLVLNIQPVCLRQNLLPPVSLVAVTIVPMYI